MRKIIQNTVCKTIRILHSNFYFSTNQNNNSNSNIKSDVKLSEKSNDVSKENIKIIKLNPDSLKQFSKKFTEDEVKKYLDPYGFVNSTEKDHMEKSKKELENLNTNKLKEKEEKLNNEGSTTKNNLKKKEYGMKPSGLEPTRYGDWERNGKCVDF